VDKPGSSTRRQLPANLPQAIPHWAVCVAVLAAVAAGMPSVGAAVAAVAAAAAVWRWPKRALEIAAFAVLAVRPSLDIFGGRRFGMSEFALNPAVIFGLGILGIAVVAGVARARSGSPLWPNKTLLRAHVSLFAAYGISFLSGARLYGLSGTITGMRELARVGSIVAAFLILLWWVEADVGRYRRGWVYLLLGMLVPVGTALWQWVTGRGELGTEGFNRLLGTFSHPNSLGTYLVPFILLGVAGLQTSKGVRRLALITWALGLTVLVALTYSRTALLALLVGLAVLPLLHSRRFGWGGLVRGLAVVLVTAALGWWLAGGLIRERFVNLSLGPAVWEAARSGASESSFTWRLINWAGLIVLGREHSVAGHGAGMTTVLNPLVSPTNDLPFNAHDDFVRIFFEGGLLGLACYLIYGALLCAWVLSQARAGSAARAASAYAVAAAWITLFFLTGGTPELSLQTAGQYALYGMTALLFAPEAKAPVTAVRTDSDTVADRRAC
jgi:O-antigen ligase